MANNLNKILFTGGSGLLGGEFKKIAPGIHYPDSIEFDVRNEEKVEKFIRQNDYSVIIHAAAITSPPLVEKNLVAAIDTNIIGTAILSRMAIKYNLRLVYISTDYVFSGSKGRYKEEDSVHPVNKYAWSKLGGECSVRLVENSLIIRTSFGPEVFPYEKAFSDQWTSREAVSIIAPRIFKAAVSKEKGVLHIGGPRKTVYEYAVALPSSKGRVINKFSIRDVDFVLPEDTSLDTSKYKKLFSQI